VDIDQKIKELLKKPVPSHIGIIMDGNGRWAKKKGRPRTFGHQKGAEVIDNIVDFSSKIGVEVLTLYSFSSENWKRPPAEVKFLMTLLSTYLKIKLKKFVRNNIRVRAVGRLDELPKTVRELLDYTLNVTSGNSGMILNLALNYSGRNEILDAVKKIVQKDRTQKINEDEITEEMFSKFLYEPEIPDPELIIRTSNEFRISNFLLWQIAYSEFYYTQKLWPEFTVEEFVKAIEDYFSRNRRFGGIESK
jgi:undecaprenyl diphosphate synthase